MAVWRNGRRDGFKTHFLTECEFDSHHGYVNRLSERDKFILLLVSVLSLLVIGAATVADLIGLLSTDTAATIDLMAVAWWFGAVMTFTYERMKKKFTT